MGVSCVNMVELGITRSPMPTNLPVSIYHGTSNKNSGIGQNFSSKLHLGFKTWAVKPISWASAMTLLRMCKKNLWGSAELVRKWQIALVYMPATRPKLCLLTFILGVLLKEILMHLWLFK